MTEENESLGGYLKRERKKRDISLEQVSYATRISLKMLSALEEDTHDVLRSAIKAVADTDSGHYQPPSFDNRCIGWN